MIEEIIAEEIGSNKEKRRSKLLSTLNVVTKVTQKKEATVDTHEMLMDSVRIMGTIAEQLDVILEKIRENHDVLEDEQNTFGHKVITYIRKLFGIADPPIDYEIIVIDKITEVQKRERIHYNQFVTDLDKRSRQYASFSVRKTPGYNRIAAQKDVAILDFLSKELADDTQLLSTLTGLDEFFKEAPSPSNRSRIKGIKMELTTLKNTLVKANQRRAEYTAYIEEQAQMKKLGITE